MVSFRTIKALLLRYLYLWRADYNTMLCSLYWPLLDILIWGFLGAFIQQTGDNNFENYQSVALLAILLWQVVGRGSSIMINAFNEEFWTNNLVNLFSLPLKISEYIISIALLYAIKIFFTNFFCTISIYLIFGISAFEMFCNFLLFCPPFLICGMWLGFMGLAVVVALGKRATELAYIVAWFLLPFSGAYYPLSVLPAWAVQFSRFFPMSYLFEAMRTYFLTGKLLINNIVYGSLIASLYLIMAILLFIFCFDYSKKDGLAKLIE